MTSRSASISCILALSLFTPSPGFAQSDELSDTTPEDEPAPSATPSAPPEQDTASVGDAFTWKAGLDLVLGSGDIGPSSFSARSLLFGAAYHDTDSTFALRIPFTSATVDSPALGSSTQSVFGNLELSAARVISSSDHVQVPLQLAVVFPVGSGDPWGNDAAVRYAEVQQSAAWSRGADDNPLYLAKHFSVVPSLAIEIEKGKIELQARQAVEIVLRAGALKPPAYVTSNMVGVGSLTALSGFANVVQDRAWLGLRAWIHHDLRPSYEIDQPGEAPSHSQLAFEPQARGKLGHVVATVGYILPVGGELGDASVHGIRLAASARF
jgi:hypothetical protein